MEAPQIQRWALTLSAYQYEISYKAGQSNGNADALSRLPLPQKPDSVPLTIGAISLMEHLEGTPVHNGLSPYERLDQEGSNPVTGAALHPGRMADDKWQ